MEWELHISQLSRQIGCCSDCHYHQHLWQWLPIAINWSPPQQWHGLLLLWYGGFPFNKVEARKRTLSPGCPTVVVDRNGDFKLVTGAASGKRIPPGVGLVSDTKGVGVHESWWVQDSPPALILPHPITYLTYILSLYIHLYYFWMCALLWFASWTPYLIDTIPCYVDLHCPTTRQLVAIIILHYRVYYKWYRSAHLEDDVKHDTCIASSQPLAMSCMVCPINSNSDDIRTKGNSNAFSTLQTMFYTLTRKTSAKVAACKPRVFAILQENTRSMSRIRQEVEMMEISLIQGVGFSSDSDILTRLRAAITTS